ncbi:hypothetical protein FRB99_002910 [Tulasnella sp. 403]|nr:hypothetical protein FRB99_002910 [Tulasnella sp. 403]
MRDYHITSTNAARQAKTAIAPLDRVKILFQASNPEFQKYTTSWTGMFRAVKAIHKDSGLRGLLQGHSATLLRVFPYAAIKFMAYDQMHHILMPTRSQETAGRRFVAGAISGTTSVFFTYPLELIRVRLAYQTRELPDPVVRPSALPSNSKPSLIRPSLRRAIHTIYHEGEIVPGHAATSISSRAASTMATETVAHQSTLFNIFPILKFYRGFGVTLVGIIPYAGTSFLVYGSLRSLVYHAPRFKDAPPTGRQKAIIDLSIGATSGTLAQTVSYPIEVVRRHMQVGGLIRPTAWLGWRETVLDIWRTRGWKGFYAGLSVGYVKMVPMAAISFMVWERAKVALGV